MKEVRKFKSALSFVDTLANIVIGLIVIGSVISFGTAGLYVGLPIFLSAVFSYILKVLIFGMAYTLIQIAENTKSNTTEDTEVLDGPQPIKEAEPDIIKKQLTVIETAKILNMGKKVPVDMIAAEMGCFESDIMKQIKRGQVKGEKIKGKWCVVIE